MWQLALLVICLVVGHGTAANAAALARVPIHAYAAKQSDTLYNLTAELAVDGNTSPSTSQGSCTHTSYGTAAQPAYWTATWFIIRTVKYVELYNRNDDCGTYNCGERLVNARVFVTRDTEVNCPNYNDTAAESYIGTVTTANDVVRLVPKSSVDGARVWVVQPTNYLTLCEVQVYVVDTGDLCQTTGCAKGTCNQGTGYCMCQTGYYGHHCQYQSDICQTAYSTSRYGTCNGTRCNCPLSGFKAEQCWDYDATPAPRDKICSSAGLFCACVQDACGSPCLNGGLCNVETGTCECSADYPGPHCEPTPAHVEVAMVGQNYRYTSPQFLLSVFDDIYGRSRAMKAGKWGYASASSYANPWGIFVAGAWQVVSPMSPPAPYASVGGMDANDRFASNPDGLSRYKVYSDGRGARDAFWATRCAVFSFLDMIAKDAIATNMSIAVSEEWKLSIMPNRLSGPSGDDSCASAFYAVNQVNEPIVFRIRICLARPLNFYTRDCYQMTKCDPDDPMKTKAYQLVGNSPATWLMQAPNWLGPANAVAQIPNTIAMYYAEPDSPCAFL